MNAIAQAAAVTWLNLRNLSERLASSSVAVFGIAGVVIVFLSVLSIAEGFQAALSSTASPDTAIVLRGGSDDEMSSILLRDDVRVIADTPGVVHREGGPLVSAELFVIVDLPKRSTGTDANVPLRGVQPAAFDVRDEVRIVEGRRFEPGRNEIIAGRGAAGQFRGLELGNALRWGRNTWTVVGTFEAGGGIAESEIWCDAAVLAPAYRRGESFQAAYVRLTSPEAFGPFKDALTTNPQLNVKVEREADYLSSKTRALTGIIYSLGYPLAALMGIAAVFGALNTMYTAVAARTREIATLRALGFGGLPVVVSVLAEALLLGLVGGGIGGLAAYFGFNGYRTSTINWQTFSQVAFSFAVTPRLLAQGIAYALILGFFGGLFPAIRAARLPVVAALREL
jgi:putative ABC transport system permease protein